MISMDYESQEEALYVVSAERELSERNPYENPPPSAKELAEEKNTMRLIAGDYGPLPDEDHEWWSPLGCPC